MSESKLRHLRTEADSELQRVIASTGCAAFGIDESGRILAWNRAAERFLGRRAEDVVGLPCHEVLSGHDVFGNRFCDAACTVQNMARRGEPVQYFQMDLPVPDEDEPRRAGCCTMVLRGELEGRFSIVHILHPVGPTDAAPSGATDDEKVHGDPEAESASSVDETPALTPREKEVLALLDQGETTQTISGRLEISVTTVRNHIQGILRKLGGHSRLEAVSIARKHRIL